MGNPADAAHWFIELVRIWQPEFAVLRTGLTSKAAYNLGTYAGYLSRVSAKAYGAIPRLEAAIRLPFGDGALLVAREWTAQGLLNFSKELTEAGVRNSMPPQSGVAATLKQPLNGFATFCVR